MLEIDTGITQIGPFFEEKGSFLCGKQNEPKEGPGRLRKAQQGSRRLKKAQRKDLGLLGV